MTTRSIPEDELNEVDGYEDDGEEAAAQAFLSKWDAEDRPSGASEEEGEDHEEEGDEASEDDPEDEDAEDGDDDEGDEDPDAGSKSTEEKIADDDAVVVFKVDGKEHRASVKDLRRLAGQEAALTQKSQAAAARAEAASKAMETHENGVKALLEMAAKRCKPYSEIDWLVASQTMDPEDLKILRADAKEAYTEFNYLHQEMQGLTEKRAAAKQEAIRAAIPETVKALSTKGSPTYIPGFSQELYNKIGEFAIKSGVSQEAWAEEVDPAAIKILWMASQYANSQDRLKQSKAAQKVTSKKLIKGNKEGSSGAKGKGLGNARDRLRKTGSEDDAAKALLAKWGAGDD